MNPITQPPGRGLFRGVQAADHDHQPVARFEAQDPGQFCQGAPESVFLRRFRRVKVAAAGVPGRVRIRQAHVDMEGGGVIPVLQNVFRQAFRRFQVNCGCVNAEQIRLFDGLGCGGTPARTSSMR